MPFYFLYLMLMILLNGCADKDSLEKLRKKVEKEKNTTIVKKVKTLENNISKKIFVENNKTIKINNEKNISEVNLTSLMNNENNKTKIEKQSDKIIDENESDLINKEIDAILEGNEQNNTIILTTPNNKKITIHLEDEKVIIDEYKNKIIIIEFFTTWCPSCIESFANLEKILTKYHESVQVIGILMEEGRRDSEILKFKEKYNINYPITNCKENFTLASKWGGVSGYPTIIIFDKNGNYFNHYNGLPPYEMLRNDIIKVLRK